MLKSRIKNILLTIGWLPALVELKKYLFSNQSDREQALLIKQYTAFYSTFIGKNDLCFDIGAHTGSRVESLLACGARVIAVEPYWPCVQYMKARFGSLIQIVHKGVGAIVEKKEMHISKDPTTNSFSEDWINKVATERFSDRDWKQKEIIQMTTINELIREFGLPKFCKIDVEGFEKEVLKGMDVTIPIVAFEYVVPEFIDETVSCLRQLSTINAAYKFNYSEGETLQMGLPEFIGLSKFEEVVRSEEFIKSSCGDIYVSLEPQLN